MKTNEVFNCARLLPFPPGAAWKTQLPRTACSWAMGLSFNASPQPRPLSTNNQPPLGNPPPPGARHPEWPLAPTRPTSITPNPWHPAKRRNRLGIYSPWSFLKKKKKMGGEKKKKMPPDCYCLRCNWACKNIRARIAWHVMKCERQEGKRGRDV